MRSFDMSLPRSSLCPLIITRDGEQTALSSRFESREDEAVIRGCVGGCALFVWGVFSLSGGCSLVMGSALLCGAVPLYWAVLLPCILMCWLVWGYSHVFSSSVAFVMMSDVCTITNHLCNNDTCTRTPLLVIHDRYGALLVEMCDVVPDGVICFFVSYTSVCLMPERVCVCVCVCVCVHTHECCL